MKFKTIGIVILCFIMCFCLTGCGNKKENEVETNEYQETAEPVKRDPKEIIADVWMSMPENVNMLWKTTEPNENQYGMTEEYKRGNDCFLCGYQVVNGVKVLGENSMISNMYYYYHHQGEYKWNSYVYFLNQGWDNWYFKGVYPASPQVYCFGRPWNILENYTDEHENITIEGVGTVDTVKGVDDEGYTYYYSKDLNMNVKIENNVQSWNLIKYETNVSSDFPYGTLPDMEALDAKAAAEEAEKANNPVEEDEDDEIIYEEDENGEVIIYDD